MRTLGIMVSLTASLVLNEAVHSTQAACLESLRGVHSAGDFRMVQQLDSEAAGTAFTQFIDGFCQYSAHSKNLRSADNSVHIVSVAKGIKSSLDAISPAYMRSCRSTAGLALRNLDEGHDVLFPINKVFPAVLA